MTWGEKYVFRRRVKVTGLWILIIGILLGLVDYPLPALIFLGAACPMVGWVLYDENEERNGPTGTA